MDGLLKGCVYFIRYLRCHICNLPNDIYNLIKLFIKQFKFCRMPRSNRTGLVLALFVEDGIIVGFVLHPGIDQMKVN